MGKRGVGIDKVFPPVHSLLLFIFLFAGYTIRAAWEISGVAFSCLQTESLVVKGVLTGHAFSLVAF